MNLPQCNSPSLPHNFVLLAGRHYGKNFNFLKRFGTTILILSLMTKWIETVVPFSEIFSLPYSNGGYIQPDSPVLNIFNHRCLG
jgi:hypothetical protein